MEISQQQEPEPKLVPLPDLRASFALREQARMLRSLRRSKMNTWAAGLMLVLLVAVGATLIFASKPSVSSLSGSPGRVDVRRPR